MAIISVFMCAVRFHGSQQQKKKGEAVFSITFASFQQRHLALRFGNTLYQIHNVSRILEGRHRRRAQKLKYARAMHRRKRWQRRRHETQNRCMLFLFPSRYARLSSRRRALNLRLCQCHRLPGSRTYHHTIDGIHWRQTVESKTTNTKMALDKADKSSCSTCLFIFFQLAL